MSASKIPDALAAADAFLSYLIDGSAQPSMSPKHLRDLIELRDLVQAARAPASAVQGDTIEQRAASLEILLTAAHKKGCNAERARVVRIRNRCFKGVAIDDDARGMIARFDGMLLRGEDVPS